MKKSSFLISLWLISFSAFSQESILISDEGTVNTCDAIFTDSNVSTIGSYGPNENFEITICPEGDGEYIIADFQLFQTQGVQNVDIQILLCFS